MRWFRKGRQVAAKARFSLPRWIKARFDAAQTTKDNAKHWGAAEFLSADAEADSSVRKILRTITYIERNCHIAAYCHTKPRCNKFIACCTKQCHMYCVCEFIL